MFTKIIGLKSILRLVSFAKYNLVLRNFEDLKLAAEPVFRTNACSVCHQMRNPSYVLRTC
jgi:hypothetical protein